MTEYYYQNVHILFVMLTVVIRATWNWSNCHSHFRTGERTANSIISRASAAYNKQIPQY